MSTDALREAILLPVKPGTLSVDDRAALRQAGVVVIEHERPEELRLLRPTADLDCSDMLRCAMKALTSEHFESFKQRELFTFLLAAALEAKRATRSQP